MEIAERDQLSVLSATVRRSNLLTLDQWRAWEEWSSTQSTDSGRATLQWLVERHWLTSWQAQQIALGQQSFFLEKYRLLRRLGSGGMGAVFQAVDEETRELAAIKLLKKGVSQKPSAVARFQREISLLSRMKHQRIIAAKSAGQVGSYRFLVMEFLDGRDLASVLSSRRRLPTALACKIAMQTAEGLVYAHQRGFIHRDIKPSNIMIVGKDADLAVKILDFGLARDLDSSDDDPRVTRAGQILGTVDYLAPEQSQGASDLDARADIYSLGVTLYEMLAGRVPFDKPSMMARLVARVTERPVPLIDIQPSVPKGLSDLVAAMLEAEVSKRTRTAQEVVEALRPFALFGDASLEALGTELSRTVESLPSTLAVGSKSPFPATLQLETLKEPVASPALSTLQDDFRQALDSRPNFAEAAIFDRPSSRQQAILAVVAAIVIVFVLMILLAPWQASGKRGDATANNLAASPDAAELTTAPQMMSKTDRLIAEAEELISRPNDVSARALREQLWLAFARHASPAADDAGRRNIHRAFSNLQHPLESAFSDGQQTAKIADGSFAALFSPAHQPSAVTFAGDDRTLTTCIAGELRLHSLIARTSEPMETRGGPSECSTLASYGDLLALGEPSGAVHLWDVSTVSSIRTLKSSSFGSAAPTAAVFLGPRELAVGRGDGGLEIWNVQTGERRKQLSLTAGVRFLAASYAGDRLWYILTSGSVFSLELQTGERKRLGQTSTPLGLYPSGTNGIAILEAHQVRYYNSEEAKTPAWKLAPKSTHWTAGCHSPMAGEIMLAETTGCLRRFDLQTGHELSMACKPASLKKTTALASSRDGRVIAAVWVDGSVQLIRTVKSTN